MIIDNNTGALVSATSAATRGDTLIIWSTGVGPTLYDPSTGYGAPGSASPTLLPIGVTLKGTATGALVNATVQYAGLAPGFVGLDQINVQIPTNAPTGTVVLQVSSPKFAAPNPVVISIQ